ncbi:MAG TPA: trypsin-like peptidase domain-containing protein [Gaiellaceae bacterium]|jgi:S1-C subfamily serine protease
MNVRRKLIGIGTAIAAIVALALPLGASAGAAGRTSDTVPGIVDIYTNLGYQGAAAAGTGIVLTSDGEILTNNHVIRGATSIRVTVLDTGKRYTATVVGYSVANDIAIVQLQNASSLTTASLGSSRTVKVGDAVAGYGNAGGAGGAPSVASGTVTTLGRALSVSDDQGGSERLVGLIETNAPLEPGDSGGPLINAHGKVVGVDTAASSSFAFNGGVTRGYAIPINHARTIAAQIVAGQKSTTVHIGKTAFMGMSVQAQNDFFGQTSQGLMVAKVVPGSPTAKAGVGIGDVLTKFDGKAVNTPARLTSLVVSKYPGDHVLIRWVDQVGSTHSASLTLGAGPPQ